MGLTLLQYWQQQLGIYQAEQTSAQFALAGAQASLAAAGGKLDIDQKALALTVAAGVSKRAALQTTAIPADAQALIATITALIITQRAQQGIVLDDQDAVAATQAESDSAAATLARAAARVVSVQATIATVKADDTMRQGNRAAIGTAPINTLKSDAAAYLAGQSVTHATTRLGKNFPAEIIAIAKKRHQTRVGRLTSLQTVVSDAQDARGATLEVDGGLAGLAAAKGIVFTRAADALSEYIATAATRFARARAVIGMLEALEIADPTNTVPGVVSAAEKAQLDVLAAAGGTAESTAESLDGKLRDVFTAEDALAAEVLTSIATDVDGVGTDPDIALKRTKVAEAKTTFRNAVAAFSAANKQDLDLWEAVVPDPAWAVLVDYAGAIASLNELSTLNPTTLVSALDTAEDEYATALGKAAIAARRADYLADAIDFRQQLLEAAQATIAARLPSAVRGDSY